MAFEIADVDFREELRVHLFGEVHPFFGLNHIYFTPCI